MQHYNTVLKKERESKLKKHLQWETLLGLARESTKKRRNKKFSECVSTIHFVMNMYS